MAYLSDPIFVKKNEQAIIALQNEYYSRSRVVRLNLIDIINIANQILKFLQTSIINTPFEKDNSISFTCCTEQINSNKATRKDLASVKSLIANAWSINLAILCNCSASHKQSCIPFSLAYTQNTIDKPIFSLGIQPISLGEGNAISNVSIEILIDNRKIGFEADITILKKHSEFFNKYFPGENYINTFYQIKVERFKINEDTAEKLFEMTLNFIYGARVSFFELSESELKDLLKIAQYWEMDSLKKATERHFAHFLTFDKLEEVFHFAEQNHLKALASYCDWYRNPPITRLERITLY